MNKIRLIIGNLIFPLIIFVVVITLVFLPITSPMSATNLPASSLPPISTRITPRPTPAPTVNPTQIKPKTPLITCTGPDKKQFQTTQAECDAFNKSWGNSTSTNTNDAGRTTAITKMQGATSWNGKLKCESSEPGYTYNYGELTYQECSAKINQYFDSLAPAYSPIVYASPTATPQTQNNTSACYSQYNTDSQRANMYGGNVGSAMLSMAQTNLTNCLSTGVVVAVGTVQQDSSPKDRDGKLCSDYPPELYSYSQSMGCP